jgi:hypothetical protein
MATGDLTDPCPDCGRVDVEGVSYHTHDLDFIFRA